MRGPDRILDAAFNRAREALRVLEDVYRFGRDDRAAARLLKRMRHRLSSLERPRALSLLAARDSAGDVGKGDDLSRREGLGSIAAANFKRAQEALRTLLYTENRILRVTGFSPKDPTLEVEVIIPVDDMAELGTVVSETPEGRGGTEISSVKA